MNNSTNPQASSQEGTPNNVEEVKVNIEGGEPQDTTITLSDTKSSENASQYDNTQTQQQDFQKQEQGKISALERERNEYSEKLAKERKEREKYESITAAADSYFRKNPEAYENWRQEYIQKYNADPGEYEKVYRNQPLTTQSGNNKKEVTLQRDIDPNDIYEKARQEAREEVANIKIMETMSEALKDYDELNFTKEAYGSAEYNSKYNKVLPVLQIAGGYRAIYPHLSEKEALQQAIQSLPEYRDAAIAKERKAAELAGRKNAYSSNAGVIGNVVSESRAPERTVTLKAGSLEEKFYNDMKRNSRNPKSRAAEIFARKMAED